MDDLDYYEDGILSGREQSPKVEYAFQDAIRKALLVLLESRGLYQNVIVDERFSSMIPILKTHTFHEEFSSRPLYLFSRGDSDPGGGLPSHTGGALGTPQFEMEVGCYLPNISTYCANCKQEVGFISHSCSNGHFMSPYPKIGKNTEQVYFPLYRCSKCRDQLITYQILRKGFKLQLTGRTSPYRPQLDTEWPASITDIVSDAFVAVAENDISAGYYHLRTAIEFYMKNGINIGTEEKIEGVDLCERYYKKLDSRLKSDFPSIGDIYSELSLGLHTRNVSMTQFNILAKKLLDHFKAKKLFETYGKKDVPK